MLPGFQLIKNPVVFCLDPLTPSAWKTTSVLFKPWRKEMFSRLALEPARRRRGGGDECFPPSANRSSSHLFKLVLQPEPLIFSRCRSIHIWKQSVFVVTIEEIETDKVKTFWRKILSVFAPQRTTSNKKPRICLIRTYFLSQGWQI